MNDPWYIQLLVTVWAFCYGALLIVITAAILECVLGVDLPGVTCECR